MNEAVNAYDCLELANKPRENCGLFAVFGVENAAQTIYRGLVALQHRGQEGAGIVVSDGARVYSAKGIGLVSDVFSDNSWNSLVGKHGIGHVRYSTTGSSKIYNVQPIVVECVDGIWAVAHNGNLINAARLRRMYQEAGAIFQTSTDSEILVHLIADPMYRNRPGRVARALSELEGSFSFLLMTKDCIIGARDRMGFRPLSLGRIGSSWCLASETCAFNQVGAEYVRDIKPGEIVTISDVGVHSSIFAEANHFSHCVFEMVYFARPDSMIFGYNVHKTRVAYGMRLAEEHPVDADIVVPIPDSGNSAALGFSRKSGIPIDYGFIRNHYVGRTFIMPDADARHISVDMKLSILPDVVKGKRVVVIDDSIVRGTTAKRRIKSLREAGAKEVHVRISSPPTVFPCYFGIDFPTKEELTAANMKVDEICRFIGADSLGYLSINGLLLPFKNGEDFCTACFTGKYPVNVENAAGKHSLERIHGQLQINFESD